MLTNTFLHIPYIGEIKEKNIWKNNVKNWDDFLEKKLSIPNAELIRNHIKLSKTKFDEKDHEFFARKLLYRHHWRAYPDFNDKCCFLDIETTGLDKNRDDLTVIGIYNGKESKVYVNGINLDEFKEDIKAYSFIITYNGYCFDLPFIKAKYPEINFNQFHVDLRFVLKSLGHTGGLKKIEKRFGLTRDSDVAGMTGFNAIRLWYKYKRMNDKNALDLLVKYNIEDIENLKHLMDFSYVEMKKKILKL